MTIEGSPDQGCSGTYQAPGPTVSFRPYDLRAVDATTCNVNVFGAGGDMSSALMWLDRTPTCLGSILFHAYSSASLNPTRKVTNIQSLSFHPFNRDRLLSQIFGFDPVRRTSCHRVALLSLLHVFEI